MKYPTFARLALLALLALTACTPPARAADADAPRPAATRPAPLAPGDHRRVITADNRPRSYLVHVPPNYDATRPTPVVLVFHGAWMNAAMMQNFSGLNKKADDANFVAVYPNGTGFGDAALFFNAWAEPGKDGAEPVDDVAFTASVLEDLATVVKLDPKRVFATGMSNGGMMCHRLAAELPDRIAAIAAVGGTIAVPQFKPTQPIPVMHLHGTADTIVPYYGPGPNTPRFLKFKSVDQTIKAWTDNNACPADAKIETLFDKDPADGTTVKRHTYGPGKAEVILIEVVNGGHTWPGRRPPVEMLGKSTFDINANDMIWAFFTKHPKK